jgi:hypothetical protein
MAIQRFFNSPQEDIGTDVGDVANPTSGTVSYVNEAGVPEEVAQQAFRNTDIASAIDQWSRNLNSTSQAGSLFFRNRYSLTTNTYDQMMQCADAVEWDEVLSATCDATEGLAFQKMSFECVDPDQEDVWNQVAADLDMDSRLREIWRELFKVSQVYVAIDWVDKIYKVRTKAFPESHPEDNEVVHTGVSGAEDLHPTGIPNPGPKKRARRKQFALVVPGQLSILDPTKVLPVGQLMFGRERFAYVASLQEHEAFMEVFNGHGQDPLVLKMFEGPYSPTSLELAQLSEAHRGPTNKVYLWLFKHGSVFRHTLSRAHYERFASIRLKSLLPILDMKSHLRASDRAALIGSTNFIVVLKRGSDKFPARPQEVEQLREQARVVARMPILVGDHRLSVEIVTPKTDFVLDKDRYDTLDERIILRALQTFTLQAKGTQGQAESFHNDVIARGIEARRHEISRTIEEAILKATVERNPTVLSETPSLSYHPKRVVISMNADVINAVIKLRAQGDISRETQLEEFNFDQEIEYIRRKREKAVDPVFKSSVPFSSPESNPFSTGAQGGRPAGGGGSDALNRDPSGTTPPSPGS